MVDRVALIAAIAKKIDLSPSNSLKFNQALEKALVVALAAFSLSDARAMPANQRDELAFALKDVLTISDLKNIAKKWDPKRTIEATSSQSEVCNRLLDLLYEKGEPYLPIAFTLAEAQKLSGTDKATLLKTIKNIAPVADLKKLAKSWDKQNKKLPAASRTDLISALADLAAGVRKPASAEKTARKKMAA